MQTTFTYLFLSVSLFFFSLRAFAVKEWYFSSMITTHSSTVSVEPGCIDVEILKIAVTGALTGSGGPGDKWGIDKLVVTLNNTNNADVSLVNLWWSTDATLNTSTDELLGTAAPAATITFDFANKTGLVDVIYYLFVTYNISTSASCGTGNVVDAYIATDALTLVCAGAGDNCTAGGDCTTQDCLQPAANQDPAGSRLIVCATSTLTAGDIAIIGMNATDNDQFTFVALINIAAGTEIRFTDCGWNGNGAGNFYPYSTGEGVLVWTAPGGGVTCGTEVTLENNAGWAATSGGVAAGVGTFSLAFAGDQILVYEGSEQCPRFVFAFSNSQVGTAWQASATSAQESTLPPGLTNGTNSIGLTGTMDNVNYNCSTTNGTPTDIRTAICNSANWTGSTDPTRVTLPVPCTFTCGAPATCYDNIKNQDETGIDCGGATCPACNCE